MRARGRRKREAGAASRAIPPHYQKKEKKSKRKGKDRSPFDDVPVTSGRRRSVPRNSSSCLPMMRETAVDSAKSPRTATHFKSPPDKYTHTTSLFPFGRGGRNAVLDPLCLAGTRVRRGGEGPTTRATHRAG
jgi:hypothetical protein